MVSHKCAFFIGPPCKNEYAWQLSIETTFFTYYIRVLIFTLSCQVAELSERLSSILTMKCSRKLSRSCWRDRQKISIFCGINSLPEKCRKCIELSRDCVEKSSVVCNISFLLCGQVAKLFERPSYVPPEEKCSLHTHTTTFTIIRW